METSYSKKIVNCSFDAAETVISIRVKWTAVNGEHTATYEDMVGLHPPVLDSKIPYQDITEELMMSWYENTILEPCDIYDSDGNCVKDTKSIELRIKEQLDDKIEEEIYKNQSSSTEFVGVGLPFTINN